MALEKSTKQIGDSVYEVTQLPAKVGYKLGLRLTKALARGSDLEAMKSGQISVMGAITKAIAQIIISLPEDDLDLAVTTFSQSTVVILSEEQRPSLAKVFDLQFAGKYDQMIEWLRFCVEVNYGPLVDAWKVKLAVAFSNALGAARPELAKMRAPSSSTSPPASPGTSSAS